VRVVHLSDLHLGHRAFHRVARGGNARERDLSTIFHQAVQEIGRLAPDLVVLSGDLFDRPDPPSTAFLALTRGIRRLQDLLPGVPVFAIAGECDTPLAPGDPGPVAVLDAVPGVEAAAGAPRSVHVRALDLHVLLVPHRSVVRPPFPELRPDPSARWNILVVRGHPADPPLGAPGPPPPLAPTPGASTVVLDPAGWDYVAIGGSHRSTTWSHHVRAAGSLERIGGDPWAEGGEEKGFLLADLATGTTEFHPVGARPVVDLAPVRVDPSDPDPGTRRLRDLLERYPGGIDGKLLRLRLRGDLVVPSEGISPGLLTGIRQRAAHLEVRIEEPGEAPLRAASPPASPPSREPGLSWVPGAGRGGRVSLASGLWAVTAGSAEDVESLADALLRAAERSSRPEVEPAAAAPSRVTFTFHDVPGGVVMGGTPEMRSSVSGSADGGEAVVPAPVRRAGAALHADWIEADGDAEARALGWARERHEAESRLEAYRERARELRDRIRILREEGASARCPTCRRPLAEAHPGLLELLEEEWEEVVQDGTWWKRRRAQLEDKPPDLLVLERRALALRAELDAGGDDAGEERAVDPIPGDPGSAPPRALLRRIGFLLQRATSGALEGVAWSAERGWRVVGFGGAVRDPARGEEALLALAIEAAQAEATRARGADIPVHLLTAGRTGVAPEALDRLLEEVVGGRAAAASWVVLVPGPISSTLSRHLRGTLELLRDDEHRARIRVGPPGQAALVLAEGG
jgi:DNA repair protein SbcD/Mre11